MPSLAVLFTFYICSFSFAHLTIIRLNKRYIYIYYSLVMLRTPLCFSFVHADFSRLTADVKWKHFAPITTDSERAVMATTMGQLTGPGTSTNSRLSLKRFTRSATVLSGHFIRSYFDQQRRQLRHAPSSNTIIGRTAEVVREELKINDYVLSTVDI